MSEISYSIITRESELEQYLLGILFISGKILPPEWVKPLHFSEPIHQRFFECFLSLVGSNKDVNVNSIRKEYKDKYKESRASALMDIEETTRRLNYNFNQGFEELKQNYIKRKISQVFVNAKGTPKILPYLTTELQKLIEDTSTASAENFQDIIKRVLEETEQAIRAYQGGERPKNAIYTGLNSFDRFIGGSKVGDMVVLAGRPGMGKSSLARCLAINAANTGIPVKIYNGEMTSEQTTALLACIASEIDSAKIRKGTLNADEYSRFASSAANLSRLPIEIEFTTDLQEFILSVKRWRMSTDRTKPAVVIVDYLQKIKNALRGRTRHQEVSQISAAIKSLAVNEKILFYSLAQLSRSVENRGGDKRPELSDLKESGDIEQDADMVMFLYRPEYYGFEADDEGNTTKGLCEIIVKKNRHGPCGIVESKFIPKWGKFTDWSTGIEPGFSRLHIPETSNNFEF